MYPVGLIPRLVRTYPRPFPNMHSVRTVQAGLVCLHRWFSPGISQIVRRIELLDFPRAPDLLLPVNTLGETLVKQDVTALL